MKFIAGHCYTNLDDYKVDKVKGFYRVPNDGERVVCYHKGKEAWLKVVQIKHDFRNNEPYIIVELNH